MKSTLYYMNMDMKFWQFQRLARLQKKKSNNAKSVYPLVGFNINIYKVHDVLATCSARHCNNSLIKLKLEESN